VAKRLAHNDLIEVRNSKIQGWGVFASRRIPKGRRIIEYVGELLTHEEVDERYDDDEQDRHHTFLFEVDEFTVIDASSKGNEARYINHSCQPNCEAVNDEGRIFIEAIKNIQPGAELSYDYSYDLDEPLTPQLKRKYPCHCGTPGCRGTILKPKRRRKKS